ncbi:MAG: ATPase, partial [Pseudomonadota bacterium]
MSHKLELTAQGDREIVITRMFDAPPHLVFDALTIPALLKRWFTGPDGWTL